MKKFIDGKSERGDHPVVRMPLRQWLLRITSYAERLIDDLALVDWPESIKKMQRDWIGKSEGAEVDFELRGDRRNYNKKSPDTPADKSPIKIRVFTTRPDTLFGATYLVLSPEHPLIETVTTDDQRNSVKDYQQQAARKSDMERTELAKTKTGVFSGGFALNPVNGESVPIWIADYVLATYGTGAIMAVPAHDERDLEFAQRYRLPVRPVVMPPRSWLEKTRVFKTLKEMEKGNGEPTSANVGSPSDAARTLTHFEANVVTKSAKLMGPQ